MTLKKAIKMNLFTRSLLTAATLGYSAIAYAGPTTCDPKDMGPSGCPSDTHIDDKDKISAETCDPKDSKTLDCKGDTDAVLVNPQTDIEIYQTVCIDPETNLRWGASLEKSVAIGSMDDVMNLGATTARCRPDHDPKRHNPDGTVLGTNTFK